MGNMQKKRLLASVIIFLLGATLFGLGLYSESQSKKIVEEIGSQAEAPIVRFTLPLNYSGFVTFNASGLYNVSNLTMLKIVNQTGAIEYFQQAANFPIQTQLFNSTGEYVATFEPMETTNSTILTVTTEVNVTHEIYPYNYLILAGSPMTFAGLIFFLSSVRYDLINKLEVENNPKKRFFRADSSTLFRGLTFSFYVFFLLMLVLLIPSLTLGNALLSIGITIATTILAFVFYSKTISFVSKVDVKGNFEKIVHIQRIAEITN